MSDYHRHNPEFSETMDLMFGVHVARPSEAVVDVDQFEEDVAVLSEMAFRPDPVMLLGLLERIVYDRYHRFNLTEHLDEAERVVAQWKPKEKPDA